MTLQNAIQPSQSSLQVVQGRSVQSRALARKGPTKHWWKCKWASIVMLLNSWIYWSCVTPSGIKSPHKCTCHQSTGSNMHWQQTQWCNNSSKTYVKLWQITFVLQAPMAQDKVICNSLTYILLDLLHHCSCCQWMSMDGIAQDMLDGSFCCQCTSMNGCDCTRHAWWKLPSELPPWEAPVTTSLNFSFFFFSFLFFYFIVFSFPFFYFILFSVSIDV